MPNSILAPATPGVYDDIINGTCELPQTYGTVISGELEEPEDRELIRGCNGNVSAVLLRDDEIVYSFTALFAEGTSLPARGANVVFPLDAGAGPISGQVMSRKWSWSREGQKTIAIKASHFKALGSSPTVDTIA